MSQTAEPESQADSAAARTRPPRVVSRRRVVTSVSARRSPAPPSVRVSSSTGPRVTSTCSSIDDLAGHTLAAASTIEADVRAVEGDKKARGAKVGQLIAERAKAAGVETVVFDRGGHGYHGRIAALADAAREGGLKF